MKFSLFTKIGMGATGLLLVVWCVLMFFGEGGEKKSKPVVKDNRCPECGRPLPKGAAASGECPYCLMEKGPEAAQKRRQGGLASSPVIPGILGGVFSLLLLTHIVLAVRRRVGGSREEPEYFYLCPKCGRKLRYRQRQIGHAGKCPMCRRVFMFPRPLEVENKSLFGGAARALRNLVSGKARQG